MTPATTATALAKQVENAELARAVDGIRSMPELSVPALEDSLRAQISAKIWWLQKFRSGPKARPPHEIQSKERELRALVQSYDIIRGRGALGKEAPS